MTIRPIKGLVCIKHKKPKERNVGGVILTSTVEEDSVVEATVVSVGAGVVRGGTVQPLDVSVGDTVYVPRFVGSPVTDNGEEYVIIRHDEILGVLQ